MDRLKLTLKGKHWESLPNCYRLRAIEICRGINNGVHYQRLGGRRLRCRPSLIRFALGRRYRLVVIIKDKKHSVKVMTHEAYNGIYQR